MTVDKVFEKMVDYSESNLHDIAHFLKVWGYARNIGKAENLDEETQFILELAAIVHDIACPLCRIKYGNTNGKNQEKESDALVREFFKDTDLKEKEIDRIAFLCSHHHSPESIDGADYQILLEADYLVNADEGNASTENIKNTYEKMFRTETGKKLLKSVYGF